MRSAGQALAAVLAEARRESARRSRVNDLEYDLRQAIRLAFAGGALFALWKFQKTPAAQGSFLFFFVSIFVQDWAMAKFKSRKGLRSGRGGENSASGFASTSPDAPGAFADTVTLIVTAVALMIMADSLFFTDWMDISTPVETPSGWLVVLTILKALVSILSVTAAVVAPVVVGVLVFVRFNDWLDKPTAAPKSDILGFFPAALVVLGCYGHFYYAYLFYQAVGGLRRT